MHLILPRRTESRFLDGRRPKLRHFAHRTGAMSQLDRLPHQHKGTAQLCFVYAGEGVHTIGMRTYHSHAGDLLLYNAGQVHGHKAMAGKALHCYTLGISGLHLRRLPENHLIGAGYHPVIALGEQAERFFQLCQYIEQTLCAGTADGAEICKHYMMSILLEALSLIEARKTLAPPVPPSLAQQVKEDLDATFMHPITLQTLAERHGVSVFHLVRTLQAQTGYAPLQYTIARRMGEAQTLLTSTEASIAKIAEAVGYDNVQYFHLLFKKQVGVPPGMYRKMTRGMP